MKYLFINPPSYQFTPAPVIGIPTLIGILSSKGISSKFIDLNMDFINKLFEGKYLFDYIAKLDLIYKKTSDIIIPEVLSHIFQNSEQRWSFYKEKLLLFNKKKNFVYNVLSTKQIYNPVLFRSALMILRAGLLSYFCSVERQVITTLIDDLEDCRSNCEDPDFNIDISYLLSYLNSDVNSLKTFYEEIMPNIISDDVKCVGITIGHYYQFIPGMLLGYMLKKYNIHVNIGGAFFNDYYKHIKNLSELFICFFDSISIDDNTKTVVQIAEYLENKIDITEIENFICLVDGKLHINKTGKMNNIYNLPYQEFFGYEKINYLIPERYLPIRASFGCYWHKCIFCMCSNSEVSYIVKPVDKLVDELEYLSKKYKTKHFYFWDNALHPQYLSKMADLLIKKNLDIKYSIYARFEKEFSYELLKKLKKSGCLLIYWGLDSASESILKYIDKGVTISNAKKVLNDSHRANIANIVFVIMGHPTETYEDIEKTYNFSKALRNKVQEVIIVTKCLFVDGSILQKHRQYYKNLILTTQEQREDIARKVEKLFNKFNGIHGIYYLMYLDKFGSAGCDFLFKYGFNIIKKKNILKNNITYNIFKFMNKILNPKD